MGGKALHEYARDVKELPRGISPRKAIISELILTSDLSYDHDIPIPTIAATESERLQERVFREAGLETMVKNGSKIATIELENIRRDPVPELPEIDKEEEPAPEPESRKKKKGKKRKYNDHKEDEFQKTPEVHLEPPTDQEYPIINLRMTVSSGTYVRSIVHDLAIAMGTKAYVRHLTRVTQGEWKMGKNVISAEEIAQNPVEVWSEKARFYMSKGPDAGEYVAEESIEKAQPAEPTSIEEKKE